MTVLRINSLPVTDIITKTPGVFWIGATAPGPEYIEHYATLLEVAEEDINNYCSAKSLGYRFNFVLLDNQYSEDKALANVKALHEMGVDVVLGHSFSSQCPKSMRYAERNNMLLLSERATSPSLSSIVKPNFLRLITNDNLQSRLLVDCYEAVGIKAVSLIYRNDDYGKGLRDNISAWCKTRGIRLLSSYPIGKWRSNGEPIVKKQRINEVLVKVDSDLLLAMEDSTFHISELGVGLLHYDWDYGVAILDQLNGFAGSESPPRLLQTVTWFGCGGLSHSHIFQEMGLKWRGLLPRIRLYSTEPLAPNSPQLSDLRNRFESRLTEEGRKKEEELTVYDAIRYDACWAVAISYLRLMMPKTVTRESNSGVFIQDLCGELRTVLSNYDGVSGYITINQFGDRVSLDHGIFAF